MVRCARGSARHCSTPAAAAPHRTHHPPRLAFAAAAGRSDQPATQTHTQAPARAHASASQRTGPDRSNRWSKPTRPGRQRLSFCPNATAASRGVCLSLLPTKRPHQIPPTPSPPVSPPVLSFLRPQKHLGSPPSDCYCRCLLPLSACLRSPPFPRPPTSPPSRVSPARRRRRCPIRGRCRPQQPWRCRPRPRLTQVRTRAPDPVSSGGPLLSLPLCFVFAVFSPRGLALMVPCSVPVGDPLYPELWRACAGPLVTVPRVGDLVFYFPQGHIEQVHLLLLPLKLSLLPSSWRWFWVLSGGGVHEPGRREPDAPLRSALQAALPRAQRRA